MIENKTIKQPSKDRYYPADKWPPEIHDDVKTEARLVRDALYNLRDKSWDIQQFTLTSSRSMNIQTIAGKPLLVVLIQDVVGGWKVSWPTKFRDSANLNLDLTANTYTTILWYPVSDVMVIAVGGMTGGLL